MLSYWCIAGLLCFLRLQLPMREKAKDEFKNLQELFDLSEEQLKLYCNIIALILGGVLLPIIVINYVYKLFVGKDLI